MGLLFWLFYVVEITLTGIGRASFHYPDELYGNELVFFCVFGSSKNTDLETGEQFILMHTSLMYVCDFSGYFNFSQDLKKISIS